MRRVVVLALCITSALIILSWNTTDGDLLFGIKRGTENIMLFVAPTRYLKATLDIALSERRFWEARRLLDNSENTRGFAAVRTQHAATVWAINKLPGGAPRQQLAQKYVSILQNFQSQLSQQKFLIGYNGKGMGQEIPADAPLLDPIGGRPPQEPESPAIRDINDLYVEINTWIKDLKNASIENK